MSVETIVLVVTAIILYYQIKETRRATYAASFKTLYDILQNETIRQARSHVINKLAIDFTSWDAEDKKQAELVCQSYDSVGIMVAHNLIPAEVVLDSWNNSILKCWDRVKDFVKDERTERKFPELWDDFENLAKEAKAFKEKKIEPQA